MNDAFIINNILCSNMDFLWENIKPMLDDNKSVLKEHEDGLRPPLDDITIKRLQSRIYGELDDAVKEKIIRTAWNNIHNILNAMETMKSKLTLYRTVIAVDNDLRPHIKTLSDYKNGDIIEFKNISSTSVTPGWRENLDYGFYRFDIAIPKKAPVLELGQFVCRYEKGEVLLPPMKCRIISTYGGYKKYRGIFELKYIESLPLNGGVT